MSRLPVTCLYFMVHFVGSESLKSVTYQTFNNNEIVSSIDATVCCQSANALDSYIGSRLDNIYQTCEPLMFSWLQDMLFVPGYSYFVKLTSLETFSVPNVGKILRYELPIEFVNGSRIEVHFKLYTGWTLFQISLTDSLTAYLTNVYSFEDEQLLFFFKAYNGEIKAEFNQFTSQNGWYYTFEYAQAMPFLEDVTQVLDLVYYADTIEVSVDGVYLYNLPHIILPNTARMLELYEQYGLEVSSVRFYGTEKSQIFV